MVGGKSCDWDGGVAVVPLMEAGRQQGPHNGTAIGEDEVHRIIES